MNKMLVFDMDGTIADFYSVPQWLEKIRAEDPSPYAEAAPMWDMAKLRRVLLALANEGWEIRIVSWLSKDATPEYKKAIRKAKRDWLARYNFPADKVHLVAYGRSKAATVQNAPGILIDDNKEVRDGWHIGETIDPTEIDDLPAELEKLLKKNLLTSSNEHAILSM